MKIKTVVPKKLKPGDKIAIIAPSCSGKSIKPDIVERADAKLKQLGFKLLYSRNCFECDILDSSTIKSRLDDLHSAFKDKSVKGIICARGGFSANSLLPYINWNLIRKNPKPLLGFSDITILSNAIYAKTGIVGYSGPNFGTFGWQEKSISSYIEKYFTECLMRSEAFSIEPSTHWREREVKLTKNKGPIVLQNGRAEGTVIGGNLCTLNLLQGTEYMPKLKDAILFIEDDEFAGKGTAVDFDRNLESLLQMPDANKIRGLLIGRFQVGSEITLEKLKHILKSKRISKKIPIIANLDFGHTTPMFTFPVGGTIRVVANSKTHSLTILKH